MKDLATGARLYVVALVAAAASVVLLALPHLHRERLVDTLVLLVLFTLLDTRAVKVGSSSVGLALGSAVILASYIIVGPWGAALVGTGGALVLHRQALVKRLYNGAQFTLCGFIAGEVYVHLGGPVAMLSASHFPRILVPVLAADLVYCLVNALMLTGLMSLAERIPPHEMLVGMLSKSVVAYLAYGTFGLLMAVLWVGLGIGPLSALPILLPLLVARWAFHMYAKEQQAYEATIRTLVQAVETKDHYTRGHSERVSHASVMLARVVGMRDERLNALRYAGILHDIGKLGVPTKLLKKTGQLTDKEFAAIQLHPVRGREMVADIEFLDEAFQGILHHHERLDGLGYPMGLAGQQIPEFARMIAVADAFDSMTSTRSYRGARSVEDAIAELERCKGTQFDPVMVDALVAALKKEPWRRHEVAPLDDVPLSAVVGAMVDHDDPTFSMGSREGRAPGSEVGR